LFSYASFMPVAIVFSVLAILTLLIHYRKWQLKLTKRRAPLSDNFLRSPGEHLRNELQALQDSILEKLVLTFTIPLIIYSTYISMFYFNPARVGVGSVVIGVIICLIFEVVLIKKLNKELNLRRIYQLGYEGEMAAGQELNMLMKEGYSVYHDFPAKGFNIDHIVIGPAGVYAVETKARSKPTSRDAEKDALVKHDGRQLQFPHWKETKPVEQAKRQAKWLSNWLTSAVGQPVGVQPVVTLPGWFVERTGPGGIYIINPKQFRSILKPNPGGLLDEKLNKQIIYQIDQKCRDIEPSPIL
jgi:hypothetical protein